MFIYNKIVGLDIHQEYTLNKAGTKPKLENSYSVDDFDEALISHCDNAVSSLSNTQIIEKSEKMMDNWLIRKDLTVDDVIYIDDDAPKQGPFSISSPLMSRGINSIPTPVSSNSKKNISPSSLEPDMVPCKHKCKNKKKYDYFPLW